MRGAEGIRKRHADARSHPRIARLLLIENLVLSVPGALLAYWMPPLAETPLLAARETVAVRLHFNSEGALVAAAAVVLAGISAALCGLLPALKASRFDVASTLKDTLSPRGPAAGRMRILLVLSQVATSVVLLVGTALMMRSVDAARAADPGFDPYRVASVLIDLGPAGYRQEDGLVFYERLRADLRRSLDGVESVSLMRTPLLMVFDFGVREFTVEGRARDGDGHSQFPFNIVSPGHFRTLKIPLLAGRDFDQRDDPSSDAVTIVNETFARRFWGSPAAAIGQRVRTADWSSGVPEWMRVVGVARDIKYARLNEEPTPYVYLPFTQAYGPSMLVHVRGTAETPALVERVRHRIGALDPNVPILEARPLVEQTGLGTSIYEVAASVLGFIGMAALALAGLGIYGLVAYTVMQSSHEIGIRVAVGAPRTHILWRFLRRGLQLGAMGVAGGAALSLATSRVLSSLLFGVAATDIASFLAAAVAVLFAALTASLVPAWRAARLDPLVALRHH
jgi:predicted permease